MIDRDGYRPNVAIVLCNAKNEVFWGKRIKEHAWQFPQGGIKMGESPEDAMYRELEEETGLLREHVKILGRTKGWLHYHVPSHWIKREWRGTYKGQKQIWYLLRLTGRDHDIKLRASTHPEFDAWRWHDYWVPLENVIEFKRDVYKEALQQLVRFLDHDHSHLHAHRPHQGHATRRGPGMKVEPTHHGHAVNHSAANAAVRHEHTGQTLTDRTDDHAEHARATVMSNGMIDVKMDATINVAMDAVMTESADIDITAANTVETEQLSSTS